MTRAPSTLLSLALFAAIAGCGDTNDSAREGEDPGTADSGGVDDVHPDGALPDADAVVWYGQLDAIAATQCGQCHADGGAAPFALTTPDDWEMWGNAAMSAIDAGRMPPWMPDPDCRDYEHERIMPGEERDLVRAWLDAGRPLGDPALASRVATVEPFESDVELVIPEAYAPDFSAADDYRCFILGEAFAQDTFVVGATVHPGTPLVHHVLTYALSGDDADTARALDADDAGPGYTCFGGPVPSSGAAAVGTGGGGGGTGPDSIADRLAGAGGLPQQIGAWVPGQEPAIQPDGIASLITEGSIVVMQIHYSAVAGPSVPDSETSLLLATTEEEPELLRTTRPIPLFDLEIPAGDPEAINQRTMRYFGDDPIIIRGITGHMHLLGTRIQADVVRADGDRECAMSIPAWDFSWQQSYVFPEGDWLELRRGDGVELTCVYDNSAANQPVVNGAQIEPRDVSWGEGTLDEMCLLYIDTVAPYVPEVDDETCSSDCAIACEGQGPDCIMACGGDELACVGCVLGAMSDCGGTPCLAQLLPVQACLAECATSTAVLGANLNDCMLATCAEGYEAVLACLEDTYATPQCALELVACGL